MLWQSVKERCGVTRDEFDRYFAGTDTASGIELQSVCCLDASYSLAELRSLWKGFHPPQGFRYLTRTELELLAPTRRAA